jgi:hypothetical protein
VRDVAQLLQGADGAVHGVHRLEGHDLRRSQFLFYLILACASYIQ